MGEWGRGGVGERKVGEWGEEIRGEGEWESGEWGQSKKCIPFQSSIYMKDNR